MPTYQFYCTKCNYQEDIYLSITLKNYIKQCPKCLTPLQRLIGTGSLFNLKGEDWYKGGIQ